MFDTELFSNTDTSDYDTFDEIDKLCRQRAKKKEKKKLIALKLKRQKEFKSNIKR